MLLPTSRSAAPAFLCLEGRLTGPSLTTKLTLVLVHVVALGGSRCGVAGWAEGVRLGGRGRRLAEGDGTCMGEED